MFLTIASGAESNRIAIVVNKYLKKEIETNLEIYLEDLNNEGYEMVLKEWDLENNPAPQELKAYLKGLYLGRGLQGAVFIGDLPIAIMEADPSLKDVEGNVYIRISDGYIADKYYMDLIGKEWTDNDKNYKFEEPDYFGFWKAIWDTLEYYTPEMFKEKVSSEELYPVPEIWLSRITVSSLTDLFKKSEVELVNTYLEKNHAYRTNQVIFPKQNLMYSLPKELENDTAFSESGLNQVRQILSKQYSLIEPSPAPAKVDQFFEPLNNRSYAMLFWDRHGLKTSIALGTETLTSKILTNFPINIATAFVFPDSCWIGHYLEPEYFAGSFMFNERFCVMGIPTATLPTYGDVQTKIMENFNNGNNLGIAFKSALQILDINSKSSDATYFQSRIAALNSRYILGDGTLKLQETDSESNENNSAMQYLKRKHPFGKLLYDYVHLTKMIPQEFDNTETVNLLFKTAWEDKNKVMLNFLIKKGADIKILDEKKYPFEKLLYDYVHLTKIIPQEFDNIETVNLLFKTAWEDKNKVMLDFLIKKGADVKIPDEGGNTILHRVLSLKFIDTLLPLDKLLKLGLDVRTKNKSGKTPWNLAKENGHAGALFISAINSGIIDQVKYLIRNGANIKAKDKRGLTALHYAVLSDNIKMVKLLIEKGADINAKDKRGSTPSDKALKSSKRSEILSLLNQASGRQKPLRSRNKKTSSRNRGG